LRLQHDARLLLLRSHCTALVVLSVADATEKGKNPAA
jgi:hypothetical protein